jgi:VWFA-related protein
MKPRQRENSTTRILFKKVLVSACLGGFFLIASFAGLAAQQQQTPVFRSSVELTSVDAGVVDNDGKPVLNLGPDDFTVQIDGRPRRVVSAEWVSLITPARPEAPPPPPGYSTNESSTGGRLILIVIDQPNIRFGGAVGLRNAVNRFIDHLQPSDRLAAVAIGPGSSTPFTADRERVKLAIARMPGSKLERPTAFDFNIAISEAMDMYRGDALMRERVLRRECGEPATDGSFSEEQAICRDRAESTANAVAASGAADSDETISALRALLIGLKSIDLPKTIVLVTEGFVLSDQQPSMIEVGNLALAARTSIYALKLDDQSFDITRSTAPTAPFGDRLARSEGIELLTSAARGSLFTVSVSADAAFARIESELSGYYLLAVESGPTDKDGKSHPIQVKVNRPGVSVRSRRQLIASAGASRARTLRESVLAAISSPLTMSGSPLQVASFSLQGPDPTKIQLLIHAAVGSGYTTSKVVSFGYVITDRDGHIVESLAGDARLPPVMNGVPSSLQYNLGSSLPPGDYTLKLGVAEGDKVGTIEHPIHAALVEASPVKLSELMVGGPIAIRDLQQPTIGHTVAFGGVQGYIEAYGDASGSLKATYEVATDADAAPLLTDEVAGRTAGRNRMIFSHVMPVRQLPPGKYVLRARVASESGPLKTIEREFEVAPPPVLMASATNGGGLGFASEIFLPVQDELFDRPFSSDEISRSDTVRAFRARVAPEVQLAFDTGVSALKAGDYSKAETSLKGAAQGDADSAAVLAYLAATFAASGHDLEAASAWQTALIDGADFPQIYQWLGDALMRTHDLGQARMILEEATAKWPADVRFAKPLALLYATFGLGREAVRTLARHIAAHQDDNEALSLGVEWIYHLHLLGNVAENNTDDVKLARSYASRYERTKSPRVALVKQWMDFLEGRRR